MPNRIASIVPVWALLSPCAQAEDLHGLFLAPQDGGPDPLVLQRPTAYDPGEWYVAGLLEVVDRTPFGGAEDVLTDGALDGLLTLDLAAGLAVDRRFRAHLALPLYLATFSETAPGTGLPGDLRLGLEAAIVRPDGATGFGLEVVPHVLLPTGPERLLLGREGPSAGLAASAGLTGVRVNLTVEAGVVLAAVDPLELVHAGAGVGARLTSTTALVAEARTELRPFEPPRLEALASLRQRARAGLHWSIGCGARFDELDAAPSWRLFAGTGYATRARADVDRDGLVGAADACPRDRETLNGWQDLDGCPDRLAEVVVVPTWRGSTIFEADVVATAGEELVFAEPGPLVLLGRPPGEAWEARAVEGCLAGRATAVLHEGDNRLVVPMEPVHDATLELVVRDARGRAAPHTHLEWIGSWPPACAPVEEHRFEGGRVLVRLGAGLHELVVHGPDGATERFDLRIRRGAWLSRHVTLEPPDPRVATVEDAP